MWNSLGSETQDLAILHCWIISTGPSQRSLSVIVLGLGIKFMSSYLKGKHLTD